MRRHDQDDRSGDADGGRTGQDADQEGRQTHDQDGDQEGVFAADEIAERPKTSAPNGRTRKPAAKASSVKMLRVVSGYWVKKVAPI
jgi:hypothetical protein